MGRVSEPDDREERDEPTALDATERNAVTGVGDPSYVSGAQK